MFKNELIDYQLSLISYNITCGLVDALYAGYTQQYFKKKKISFSPRSLVKKVLKSQK